MTLLIIGVIMILFQSSPSLGAGSNVRDDHADMDGQKFQSSPSLGAGSNVNIIEDVYDAQVFQSSPSLGAGSNTKSDSH